MEKEFFYIAKGVMNSFMNPYNHSFFGELENISKKNLEKEIIIDIFNEKISLRELCNNNFKNIIKWTKNWYKTKINEDTDKKIDGITVKIINNNYYKIEKMIVCIISNGKNNFFEIKFNSKPKN